ncbi:MAG TPA: MoaD/ThiS family protein [Acidimicrobiales bacterium]|nr:MoaD/ThiS family protein [Acidimicrobiales bacterium]
MTATVHVVLPAPLRTLAALPADVPVTVDGAVTLGAVLDALEARHPVLQGTIRDRGTGQRRPFVRFFACEEDLSHEPTSVVLPAAVASGAEPLVVLGAMAGG